MSTGAVSRYELSRRQEFITVQEFDCGQLRESGYRQHYKSVLVAGTKAKTVTNNLPILSVLAEGVLFIFFKFDKFYWSSIIFNHCDFYSFKV
jgi:hypothetical protein